MKYIRRVERIIENFTKKNLKIAIAESCTGGYISNMITNVSGSSKVFERGIICYSNQAKIELVKVDPKLIEDFGAVSKEVVRELANNIRVLSNVEIGIGVSGIAGPTGGTIEKPVGLVYIGFSTEKETIIKKYNFTSDRITFKKKVFDKVLKLLEDLFIN
jgi:nicotinamide-nucleotide amidase